MHSFMVWSLLVYVLPCFCSAELSGIKNEDVEFKFQYTPATGTLQNVVWYNKGIDGLSSDIIASYIAGSSPVYHDPYNDSKVTFSEGFNIVTLIIHNAMETDLVLYTVQLLHGTTFSADYNLTTLEEVTIEGSSCGTVLERNGSSAPSGCRQSTVTLTPRYPGEFSVTFKMDNEEESLNTSCPPSPAICSIEHTFDGASTKDSLASIGIHFYLTITPEILFHYSFELADTDLHSKDHGAENRGRHG